MQLKSVEEVAAMLGVSKGMLYREHSKGVLPMLVFGSNRFIEEDDLKNFLNVRRVVQPPKRKMRPETIAKMRETRAKNKTA